MAKKIMVGWREFCALPTLKIPLIKAKIDTGAKTSALHASNIQPYERHGKQYVKFTVEPIQNCQTVVLDCHAEVIDQRSIRNSFGAQESRYIIKTVLQMQDLSHEIELSLTNRMDMRFRMLLGRAALKNLVTIDPGKSYCLGRYTSKELLKFYK